MHKINFILNNIGTSGGAKVIRKYSTNFNKMGYDTCIYIPLIPYIYGNQNYIIKFFRKIKGTIGNFYRYFIKKEQKEYKDCNYKIAFLIKNPFIRNADVTIATAWVTAYDVAKLNEKKGKKFYFVQDYEIWDDEKKGKKTYTLPLKKIVISTWIKNKLEEQGIKENMQIVYNGIDVDLYRNDNKNFEHTEINCLMLGHKLKKKGVKEGLDSFYEAKKTVPNLKLRMFGINKKDVNNLNIDDIEFIENPDKKTLINLYKNTDIFIFPSLEEGWGLTVIEAMCAKCAVVGTNTGCLVDIGKNGKNALITEPGNVEEMTKNIIKLAKDKKLRENISNEGFETAKNFDWNKQAEKFIKILNEQ